MFGSTTAAIVAGIALWSSSVVEAIDFTTIASPNLDLSGLGRTVITGSFDAISIYEYQGQNENPFSTNGSQSLLQQIPNGAFATLVASDASINTMCPFVRKDESFAGVVVGGNFTSLGGVEAQGVAMWDPTTNHIIPLTGLSGSVSALYCDAETDTVYVGGDFKGGNSTNAIAWVGMTGWANLPFAGFNDPVTSIAKLPSGNVVFGGSFTGIGNTTSPANKDQQAINLSSAKVTSGGSTATAGFSDPKNIVCKTSGQDGAGNAWLLADDRPGFWRADMDFGYEPTKLRIWNTHQDGRGTKTFRYTAFPINGIMNLTYTDPTSKQNQTCDARCPLSNDPAIPFQDFHFVNAVGMNAFQIDISEWYGSGGGFDGIELFQDDIYAYAVASLNEPACTNASFPSKSTTTGPWTVTPSGGSTSQYLTANLAGPNINADAAQVVFLPDIKQSGNYTVTIYTPGCQQDKTCSDRGGVTIGGTLQAGVQLPPVQLSQTNDFEKYDQIYHGLVDASSSSFRPSITLAPTAAQKSAVQVVALRVRFQLLGASSGGLNALFEFNPNTPALNMDFSQSAIDVVGSSLDAGASVTSLEVIQSTTYVAGRFSGNGSQNIMAIVDGTAKPLQNGGLDAAVASMFRYGNLLFVGGNFSNTATAKIDGLNNVATYDTASNQWQALGQGVDGPVLNIVPLSLNITSGQPETCITISGRFSTLKAHGNSKEIGVGNGFAVWVPSRNDWLQNLDVQTQSIHGSLTASTNITGGSPLLAGTLAAQGTAIGDAVTLSSANGEAALGATGLHLQPPAIAPATVHRRDLATTAGVSTNIVGAVTGLFDGSSGRNNTIVGGNFTAIATNGSTISNLAIINTTSDGTQTITGFGSSVDASSVFLALAAQSDTLYAGGIVNGTASGTKVNGLVFWDLARATFLSTQPPPLAGTSVIVNAISIKPSDTDVYVGGSFDGAGSLPCAGLCVYKTSQWSKPGLRFSGNVSALMWQGNTNLLVGGNLTVDNNPTNLANYETSSQVWTVLPGVATLSGPVAALTPANSDGSQFWAAGAAKDGSAYLVKYDGSAFRPVGSDVLDASSVIRGLSVLSLSQNHDSTPLVDANVALLVTGALSIPGFGNASAALYNGTALTPFILSNLGNRPGSLSQLVTERQQTFSSGGGHLAVGFVVLIALAIALALIFLVVLAGFLIERRRKKLEGYQPAPQNYFEKPSNVGRIPPERLFENLGAPMQGPRV